MDSGFSGPNLSPQPSQQAGSDRTGSKKIGTDRVALAKRVFEVPESLHQMASIFATLVISCVTANLALSARIVGFTSMASGSHYLLTMTILEELASRGHEVCARF